MHTDEAVHTVKFADLWLRGQYAYDLHDYHGPTMYYATLVSAWLGPAKDFIQTTEFTYRIVPVVFGACLVLLLLGIGDGLGRPAAVCAGVLTAISPAMVFYSRYYIMEVMLVFFTFGAIVAAWRYVRTRKAPWAVLAGACLGFMHATKETCVIAFAAILIALVTTVLWERWVCRRRIGVRPFLGGWVLARSIGAAALVSVAMFSIVFQNWTNVLDSLRTYAAYLTRSGGAGAHEHPWYYYFQLLLYDPARQGPLWTEGLIVGLAAVGAVAGLARKRATSASLPLIRFLAFYTIVLTAIYCVIPYKTPWCMLGLLHGMILLAGFGAVEIVRLVPHLALKGAVCLALAAGAGHLGWQAYRAGFQLYADNPYAYAHPTDDVYRLVRTIEDIAAVHRDRERMVIKVIVRDGEFWPLPWYLRRFPRVGYYRAVPANVDAPYDPERPEAAEPPVIIASPDFEPALMQKLRRAVVVPEERDLRPRFPVRLYVRPGLWDEVEHHRTHRDAGGTPAMTESTSLYEAGGKSYPVHCFTHSAMGGPCEIRIIGQTLELAEKAAGAALAELDRLENQLSRFIPGSEVSRVNSLRAGESLRVGNATLECLQLAARLNAETKGAFDVTILPLLACLRKAEAAGREPAADELAAARARVGMRLLDIDAAAHTVGVKADGVRIDLGAIGKGYAVDRMVAVLRDHNIQTALVHTGTSSVYVMGAPPGQTGWRLILRDPDGSNRPLKALMIRDRSLSGSGIPPEGRHVVDPRSGRFAEGKFGTWVVAPSAALSDGLSTAFMVMSREEIEQYCRQHPDLTGIVGLRNPEGMQVLQFGEAVFQGSD